MAEEIKMIKKTNLKLLFFSIPILVILLFFIGKNLLFVKKAGHGMNVILITVDTLRADHVGVYNKNEESITPNIDRLAYEGVVFEHCIAHTPLTLPSHVSILSGTYPLYHQVKDNGSFIVPDELKFISEIFKENNYSTSAFIAAFVLHSKWGLAQGFDTYSDDFDLSLYKTVSLSKIEFKAEKVFNNAKKWIKENKKNKFFSWIHLYDPHYPYSPPSPFIDKFKKDLYKGEIAYTDSMIGKFIKFLKDENILDNTIIILTADHGEGRGDHKEDNHGFFIYESVIHVPALIRAPFKFPVNNFTQTIGHVDLMPTILDLVGLPIPDSCQGRSLVNELNGEKAVNEITYTETYYPQFHYGWSNLKALYSGNYKFILSPKPELFNISTDRNESDNIYFKYFNQAGKIKKQMEIFIKKFSKNRVSPIKNNKMNAADIKRFKSLGYLSGSIKIDNKTKLADPKEKFFIVKKIKNAMSFVKAGDLPSATKLVLEILENDNQIIDAHVVLGNIYVDKGNYKRALQCFNEAMKLKPHYNIIMSNVLNCYIKLKMYDDGINRGIGFLKIFPRDATILLKLGEFYFLKKEFKESEKYFTDSLEQNHFNSKALSRLAEINIIKNNKKKAKEFIEKIKNIKPDHKMLPYLYIKLNLLEGNISEAVKMQEQEIKNNPLNADSIYNLGLLNLRQNNHNKALENFFSAKKLNPELRGLNLRIAQILGRKGNHKKAEKYLREELKYFHNSTPAYYSLAIELYQQRKLKASVINFKKAIDLKPDFVDALYNLGIVLSEIGEKKEAISYFEKLIKIKPKDIYARIKLGELVRIIDKNKALSHFKIALTLAIEKGDKALIKKITAWISYLK